MPSGETTCRQLRQEWFRAGDCESDVLVVGGGALGAATYHHLKATGLRVVLAERHDFAAGSSQGSAGLVWGGLLYLRHGHLREVASWCRERDRLRRDLPQLVAPHTCVYRMAAQRRSPFLVGAGLALYWLLGAGRTPRRRSGHLVFQEARLQTSDARFTWEWITSAPGPCTAFNRCDVESFRRTSSGWDVTLRDSLDGLTTNLRTRWVVNATGPWAEELDRQAGIVTDWRLVLSRGTSLVVPRSHGHSEIVEHPTQDDALSLVPFGNASVWGSTETVVSSPTEGFDIPAQEVTDLITWYHRLIGPLSRSEIIALRVGVRALAVPANAGHLPSQSVARACRIVPQTGKPWISLYGGKLSGCAAVARQIVRHLVGTTSQVPAMRPRAVPQIHFPGLTQSVADPRWCHEHEQCWTLADWLRRRTDIAQLVPRGGFGRHDEYRDHLANAARVFADGNSEEADRALTSYLKSVNDHHDRLLGCAPSLSAGVSHD
jgi:glycerol-3-phosphate dehydrogenase